MKTRKVLIRFFFLLNNYIENTALCDKHGTWELEVQGVFWAHEAEHFWSVDWLEIEKKGFFSGREYRELAEITEMINETIVQVALQ